MAALSVDAFNQTFRLFDFLNTKEIFQYSNTHYGMIFKGVLANGDVSIILDDGTFREVSLAFNVICVPKVLQNIIRREVKFFKE